MDTLSLSHNYRERDTRIIAHLMRETSTLATMANGVTYMFRPEPLCLPDQIHTPLWLRSLFPSE